MQIGTVKIDGRLVLAPMAGVTDLAFRRICREHGAALTVTEMVSYPVSTVFREYLTKVYPCCRHLR